MPFNLKIHFNFNFCYLYEEKKMKLRKNFTVKSSCNSFRAQTLIFGFESVDSVELTRVNCEIIKPNANVDNGTVVSKWSST